MTRIIPTAIAALALLLAPAAWAQGMEAERAAETQASGYRFVEYATVSVGAGAAVTLTTGLVTERSAIRVCVTVDALGAAETDRLWVVAYSSTAIVPSVTAHIASLTSGQCWSQRYGSGVTVKAISSAGTILARVEEAREGAVSP